MDTITLDQARAAKRATVAILSGLDSVVGVGITRVQNQYAVKVNLSESLPPGICIPKTIDGVPVRVEITGVARAQASAR